MIGLMMLISTMIFGAGVEHRVENKTVTLAGMPELTEIEKNAIEQTAEINPNIIPENIVVEKTDAKDISDFYKVIKVVDGDTFAVEINGKSTTIRMIGVDTPETVDPRKPVQCFGVEASNKSKVTLGGQNVKLEFDASQGKLDKYGRLLAYVILADGTNFNEKLIRDGYAHEYTYNLPYKYQTAFKSAEKFARENEKGLWAPGVCEGLPVSLPRIAPVALPAPTAQQGEYICTYNAYNCGSFATHSQAQSAYDACGGVASDVHGLDRDQDGLACETLPD